MNFKWVKTNTIIKKIFSNLIWDIPNLEKKIYLTFDDGPIPEVTEWVLDVLKTEEIKATFFCIGDNIQKHPAILNRIIVEGHQIGNHTFNHLNGWKTNTNKYIQNFKLCENEIRQFQITNPKIQIPNSKSQIPNSKPETRNPKLFRPPYGKIKPLQSKIIRKLGYKIIMWDVLSYDFDPKITPEKCLDNIISNTSQGSIIVFHDSEKAAKNMKYALPKAIHFLKNKGFLFDVIK